MKAIFSEEYKQLVKKLHNARIASGLSQKQLSERLGRSQSYISKIEQGQIRLDIVQLKEIAHLLGLDYKNL